MRVRRLSDESTGECPLCGERAAFPYAIPGVSQGYVDACPRCAPTCIADAAPRCAWFARCTNPATGTEPHPVLGDVPICDRCRRLAGGEGVRS